MPPPAFAQSEPFSVTQAMKFERDRLTRTAFNAELLNNRYAKRHDTLIARKFEDCEDVAGDKCSRQSGKGTIQSN
jgi:hypothetical protein